MIINEQQFLEELKSRYGDWALPTLEANKSLVDAKDTREIGKSRQHSAELLIVNWLNSLSLGLDVKTQKELHDIKNISEDLPEFDHNESGFDAYCINTKKTFQIKYRGGQNIHMEQTRRSSEKNKGAASSTGHVVYSQGEFDVLIVVRPEEISSFFDASSDILVISENELRDPANPGFLLRSVGKKQEKDIKAKIKNEGAEKVLKEILK